MRGKVRVRGGMTAAWGVCWAMVLGGCSALAAAAEVYQSVGEHGEASYTDEAVAGAQQVRVDAPQAPAGAAAEAERRIEQTLEVARALEQSRLAREAARATPSTQRPAPAPAARPAPAAVRTYPDPYRYAVAPDRRYRDGHGGRRDESPNRGEHDRHERTLSKPMVWRSDETER